MNQNIFCVVVAGTSEQEIDDWPLPHALHEWAWSDYEFYLFDHLSAFSGHLAADVQNLYARTGSPHDVYTSLVTDIRVHCPVDAVASLLERFWKEDVYRYVNTFQPHDFLSAAGATERQTLLHVASPRTHLPASDYDDVMGADGDDDVIWASFRHAYHSIDLYHFFMNETLLFETPLAYTSRSANTDSDASATSHPSDNLQAWRAASRHFSAHLRRTVLEFARSGSVSDWEQFPQTKLLSANSSRALVQTVEKHNEAKCTLWRDTAMFPKYAWMT